MSTGKKGQFVRDFAEAHLSQNATVRDIAKRSRLALHMPVVKRDAIDTLLRFDLSRSPQPERVMPLGDAPGPRSTPAVSGVNIERAPSRRAASSPTALAVSNGSAAHRRLRGAFSPPQSPTARAAQRARAAAQDRQASKAANVTRDAARGAGTSGARTITGSASR